MNECLLMTRQVKSGKQESKSREELQWHKASAATVTHIHVHTLAPRSRVHLSQHYLCSRCNDEDKIPGCHESPNPKTYSSRNSGGPRHSCVSLAQCCSGSCGKLSIPEALGTTKEQKRRLRLSIAGAVDCFVHVPCTA